MSTRPWQFICVFCCIDISHNKLILHSLLQVKVAEDKKKKRKKLHYINCSTFVCACIHLNTDFLFLPNDNFCGMFYMIVLAFLHLIPWHALWNIHFNVFVHFRFLATFWQESRQPSTYRDSCSISLWPLQISADQIFLLMLYLGHREPIPFPFLQLF